LVQLPISCDLWQIFPYVSCCFRSAGLERGRTAEEALTVITDLLEEHGQGGPCSNRVADFSYHNSFLIADPREAWVLETAGRLWAAERVAPGSWRNISNCMSITTAVDRSCSGLKTRAAAEGWWDEDKPFNWSQVMGAAEGNSRVYEN
jgi:secernin